MSYSSEANSPRKGAPSWVPRSSRVTRELGKTKLRLEASPVKWILVTWILVTGTPVDQTARSASSGSTRVARRAGI